MYIKKEDLGGLVILFVMIVIIAAFFVFAPNASELSYKPIEQTGSQLTVVPPDLEHLGEVRVDTILKAAGFVTFHEAIGQAPGAVVGSSIYLEPGEYKDLVIKLAKPLEANNQYFALMFADNGNHAYDTGVDLPVMSDGKVIKIHFITPEL